MNTTVPHFRPFIAPLKPDGYKPTKLHYNLSQTKVVTRGMSFYYLRKNVYNTIEGNQKCFNFATEDRNCLVIFNMKHVRVLNDILYDIVCRNGVLGEVQYRDKDEPQFFKIEVRTALFNKEKKQIKNLPAPAFDGRIALNIVGFYVDSNETVKLLTHVHQIQVLEQDEVIDICMF